MKQLFALSAIGRDRPGIVADLAELIYECDCNLEDSRMTILGSEFAVLLLLSGQGADVERRLSAGCKRLEWEKRLTCSSVRSRPTCRRRATSASSSAS
jgi:glycine cleavage system transcriptional repressor